MIMAARDATRWQLGLAATVAVVMFWAQPSLDPTVGLDPSWQAGLAMARDHHIAWGPDLVFTYGPLGFLQSSNYYFYGQSVLATFYQAGVVAALFLGIAAALRQRHGAPASLTGAFVTIGVTVFPHIGHGISLLSGHSALELAYPELGVLAAFTWASALLLHREPRRSTVLTTCAVLAAFAGFQMLVKISTGLVIAAMALGVSVLMDWRAIRRHCITIAAFAASLPMWWMLAGQRLGDLPTWLRYAGEIVAGYPDGMAAPPLPVSAVEAGLVTLAWAVALYAMVAFGSPTIPRRFVLLTGLTTTFVAKAAFGRFEPWHFGFFLGMMVVAVAITPLPWPRRPFVVAVIVCCAVSIDLSGSPAVREHAIALLQAPVHVADRLITLALPGRHEQRVDAAKKRQRALYAVPDRFIAAIGSTPVHIDPQEISAAWAYDLNWRPTPVFQTYPAWSPTLDKLNAESLTKRTPLVLSRISSTSPATGIDGRLGVQESPLYTRALLCDYKVSGVENRWALFARTDPRCGPLTPLSQIPIRQYDSVSIPAQNGPNTAILVGIDVDPDIKDRLFQGSVAPLTNFTVILDGVVYRLVAKNAAEPFLVTAPASAAGTNLQILAHRIGIGRSANLNQPEVTARLRFYEMRVNP